jgi:hypothetical protein
MGSYARINRTDKPFSDGKFTKCIRFAGPQMTGYEFQFLPSVRTQKICTRLSAALDQAHFNPTSKPVSLDLNGLVDSGPIIYSIARVPHKFWELTEHEFMAVRVGQLSSERSLDWIMEQPRDFEEICYLQYPPEPADIDRAVQVIQNHDQVFWVMNT